tara:strand:- start:550 stop:750 length:201 start_codon:yes stop_codon:yes gene_type:complete
MIEHYAFLPDGSLAFTTNDPAVHAADIAARSLTVVESTPCDLDYTYTLVDGKIVSTHTPQQPPPEI